MGHRSRNRGVLERRSRRRRRLRPLVGLVVVVCGLLLAVYSLRTSDADTATSSGAGTSQSSVAGTSGSGGSPAAPAKQVLRVTRLTRLAAAVQDAAVTTVGSRAYAFGGLDAAGTSTATISVLQGSSVRTARETARADPRRGGRCLAVREALRAGRRPVRRARLASPPSTPPAAPPIWSGRFPRRSPTWRWRPCPASPTSSAATPARSGRITSTPSTGVTCEALGGCPRGCATPRSRRCRGT